MLKRPEQIFKLLCLLLAAALALEVARVAARGKPLKNLAIPALPTFASTNATAATNSATAQNAKGTNAAAGTNASASGAKGGTNQATAKTDAKGTNKPTEVAKSETNATKVADSKGTNTSEVKAEAAETNVVMVSAATTNSSQTNSNLSKTSGTNTTSGTNGTNATNESQVASAKSGTNAVASAGTTNKTNSIEKTGTNSAAVAQKSPAKGTGPGGRPDTGKKGPDVPPAMKARIDRITQSEILAPVMRPMPMALLGIAGDQALIRSPEGQSGLVKEGKELGTIKLLKIGTNRVLIEEKGEKKELTIFSGFGGESLMPKEEKKGQDTKKDAKLEPKKTEEKDTKPNDPTKKSA